MFDTLNKNQRQEEVDEQTRLRFMAQSPAQARALASYEMAGAAGRGLGQAAAGFAGKDPRTSDDRLQTAMRAIGDMQQDHDLTTPEGTDNYYRGVIRILGEQGLPGEAHAAAKEWNEHKNKAADRKVKEDDIKRKADEAARKAAIGEEANRIKAARNAQLAEQGLPEFIQITDRIEKTEDPVTRKRMLDYANALVESKKKGIAFEDAGDRIIVRDKATGAILGTDQVGEKPMAPKDKAKIDDKKKAVASAYQAAMLAAQTDYKAAADFYNHPGLNDLIGKWSGLAAERGTDKDGMLREAAIARLSPAGQEALALFQQVQGGAFVRALQDLKLAGGGSTGLGPVTEAEGAKVTAAKGALFPRQQPESFRRKLADFISVIEQSANILAGKAQEDGLDPIHLNVIELTGPGRSAPAPAPTAPRAAPRAAPTGDRVRVLRPDGQTGTVPRAKLEEYKRKGYTEIK
jgi:hypothetical protein